MPKKEPYNGEITPEKLRELLWAEDFTKMPVRDPSEYNEKEAKLYKTVEKYIKQHFDEITRNECAIEVRLIPSDCTIADLKKENERCINGYQSAGERVVLIDSDYEQEIQELLK